jgi:hypothetical protein
MSRFRSGCRVIRVVLCNGGVVGHPSPGAGGWHFVVKYSEHKLNIKYYLVSAALDPLWEQARTDLARKQNEAFPARHFVRDK